MTEFEKQALTYTKNYNRISQMGKKKRENMILKDISKRSISSGPYAGSDGVIRKWMTQHWIMK